MITLSEKILSEIRDHARDAYPRESCGLVIVVKGRHQYIACRNIAESSEHFVISPKDYAQAEDAGEVVMIVHSHPNVSPQPSQADKVSCEQSGLPWLIVNWPTGAVHQFEPSGYVAPLIGRVFAHGVLDCLSLIQDYYRQELGIILPQYEREDNWWEKGQSLYLDLYEVCGFMQVSEARKHDVLLMQVAAKVPNHGAVFLGDNTMIHHQMGRLSSRDVYGGWYQKITTHILRHRSLA